MLRYERRTRAPADVVWALVAQPGNWARWAPHLRGADGLGAPEVALGARGSARLLGVVRVPAQVTAKRRGSLWTWKVGPLTVRHRVSAVAGGTLVAMELEAPGAARAGAAPDLRSRRRAAAAQPHPRRRGASAVRELNSSALTIGRDAGAAWSCSL